MTIQTMLARHRAERADAARLHGAARRSREMNLAFRQRAELEQAEQRLADQRRARNRAFLDASGVMAHAFAGAH